MNSNLSAGRLTAIIAGGVLASLSMLVLAVGVGFAWLGDKKDADGYYTTSSERFSTGTHALASENLDIDGVPGNHFGNVSLNVRSNHGTPVFVGIAPSQDVDAYLSATAHATLTDFDVDPFAAEYRTTGGGQRPAAPATETFWAAKAQGTGTQKLTWDVKDGDWSVVVMNADGSASVDANISAGADLPIVDDVRDAALIAGIVLFVGGGGLLAGGLLVSPRRREIAPLAV